MYRSDDPLKDFDMYEAEQSKAEDEFEKRLPICSECGERIHDDYLFDINGELYCQDCMEKFEYAIDNYIADAHDYGYEEE